MTALLLGQKPPVSLGYTYVTEPPYEAVVIGSMTAAQLLRLDMAPALDALTEGKTVLLYTPGLPRCPHNRALAASLASRQRELKNWGIVFSDGAQKRLVTAQDARAMRAAGTQPVPGSVLTPLAKEILEGSQ